MAFAGQFNEEIEIYSVTNTADNYGGSTSYMTLAYSTRAKVGHIGGSRAVLNSEIQFPYQKNFVVRYYVPVNDTDVIKYNSSYYTILSIDENREMQMKTIVTEIENE